MSLDIQESAQKFLDWVCQWLNALRNPRETCGAILAAGDERAKLSKALNLWLVAFLVTLVVQFPILHSVGIAWDDLGFHLPAFGLLTISLVALGFAIHAGLRLFRIPSTFSDVMSMYTAYVVIYTPLFSLFTYPQTFRIYSLLGMAKRQGLGLTSTSTFTYAQLAVSAQHPGMVDVYNQIIMWCMIITVYIAMGTMAVAISQRYGVMKTKAFSAVSFGVGVFGLIAIVAPTAAYYFAIYSSAADKGPLTP